LQLSEAGVKIALAALRDADRRGFVDSGRFGVAVAAVEERQLLKTLRWYDGFVIALANPGFLLGSLGYSVGDLGGWGAMMLWGITAAIAVLLNMIYSELAAMFPDKPGGIALFAHEGWRKYFTLVGPIATFGYWIAWSVVLAIFGIFIGQIVTAAWFGGQPYGTPFDAGWFSTGPVDVGLPHVIAAILIVAVWLFNVFGVRVSVTFGYLAGVLLMIPLFCFIVLPYFTGDWESANLTNKLNDGGLAWGGLQLAIVWMWIMTWSAWGVDVCATFAPEYKDTVNDTKLALRSAAIFSLFVYTLLPLGMVGAGGEEAVAAYDYVGVMNTIVGSGLTDFFVVVISISFLISMNTATADGGRAVYGIARDGMTLRQLFHLNKHHVPGRAMTLDMFINILFVFFVGNIFGILAASNLGYVLAHFFALTAFMMLRRDRPAWPRPIRLPNVWVPIAGVLAAFCLVLTVVGFGWFQIAAGGYGGTKEKIIGLGVLASSVVLFAFRRLVQDKQRIHWREDTPETPDQAVAPTPTSATPVSG
jgi:amino acid transporter